MGDRPPRSGQFLSRILGRDTEHFGKHQTSRFKHTDLSQVMDRFITVFVTLVSSCMVYLYEG